MPAPTDWTALAKARGLSLRTEEMGRVLEPLAALERVFRPLTLGIPSDLQPALVFSPVAPPATDGDRDQERTQ